MSEKRRGLGRGLGALIPTSSEGTRPVDVFFPSAPRTDTDAPTETSPATESGTASGEIMPVGTAVVTLEAGSGPADVDAIAALSEADIATLESISSTAPADVQGGASEESSTAVAVPAAAETRQPDDEGVSRETATSEQGKGAGQRDMSASGASGVDDWAGGAADDLVPVPGARFAEIPVTAIRPNPRQPRSVFDEGELDELVGSIREIGVLQPVVVRPVSGDDASYELIMGERRWRATQAAGLAAIPAIIRETDDGDLLRDALLENLHRSALNPLEEAAAYRQLLDDFGCTHEELAERISRSRPQISNTLRLLRLPPLVQRRVAAGVLSAGHARALLGLTDGAEIERLAQRIVAEGLSVRATEEIVAMGGLDEERRQARTPRAGQRSEALDGLATRLSDRFETRVKVDLGKNKGRLTVEFASVEDLNRILDLMAPDDPGLLRA
ncbi:ParB/RepB/Spo0J family partition protein [Cellulosimicrobium sp. CUA-896]|uniref:ParB/RepB/Spo0J family partition protein n=1 Tax=Cellulosimicrobium sp. CUA-896 TaxID=1517881 RepID=UPI00095EB809|nr:ParB/RepB/Spo0J family partition protein [Cellulosimicrobium sp. CUA-896]OLT54437.1 chromosome partitioning protein ParB [Cellulosimicrobium sp. CUA-896]